MAELPGQVQLQVRAWEQRMRAAGCAAATLRTRTVALRAFVGSGGDALAPAQEDIVEWLAGQAAQWTRLTYHSSMRSWCDHLICAGVLGEEDDPMRWVKRPRTPKRHPRAIADHDLALVLERADGRTRAFVLLGAFAGLRVSEIARMRGEVVTERTIRVLGKGGRGGLRADASGGVAVGAADAAAGVVVPESGGDGAHHGDAGGDGVVGVDA